MVFEVSRLFLRSRTPRNVANGSDVVNGILDPILWRWYIHISLQNLEPISYRKYYDDKILTDYLKHVSVGYLNCLNNI